MENYLIHTKNSFDKIADGYDEEDYSNEILQWMRNVVYEVYLSYFKKGDSLLELNAGTGIDAVFLAEKKGIKVYATDISDLMLEKLNLKINSGNLTDMIKTENVSFGEIGNIKERNFDGAVSNFGGLNCISDFSKLSEDLSEKIKPGGYFIAAVMNKFCPWEIFYFLMKLDPANAFRRFNKNGIDANLDKYKIKSFYFYPAEFASGFKKYFELEKIYSLGLFTPSPYLHGIYKRMSGFVETCMKADNAVREIFPFNKIGDHFIIVLKRKQN